MSNNIGELILSRRRLLKSVTAAGVVLTTAPILRGMAHASQADIEGSKKEGKLVWYTSIAPEEGVVAILGAFRQKYPWIDVSSYLRLQNGRLYPKLLEETTQGAYLADVFHQSELAYAIDFTKRGFFDPYKSPEAESYDSRYKDPDGAWTGFALQYAGMSYNPNITKPEDAPKKWSDLLDPKWGGGKMNVKDSNSGAQYAIYQALYEIYGAEYWDKFAAQKPIVLPGQQQQYERIINGEDLINANASPNAWSTFKQNGAPLEYIYPEEGVPSFFGQGGIVKGAPHPHSARLFMDFFCSKEGQTIFVEQIGNHSPHPDLAPPRLLPPLSELKLLVPSDAEQYVNGQAAWREKWKAMGGA
ncbi:MULTISPECIES: ABC transporter substrate-binding protein [unclassified Shinella]|uniref:ABC transporter substrate-binding protein n=1 Tax=unclassified Shinella TaxID=2643062 RepID=UPI00225D5487|nr:extracellular solute-binding protein [Shinella sp. YE25]MDC7260121.1 extracellular solute-binding protein [Shinella sp. YE25]CAI0341138.1 hypothetical protein SHINE37_60106 [Rhizobiaceae bacterium]CAK7262173.1 iron(III) transport system substrate-binding protein [Shinella sp. WSC3-e]